MTNERDALIEKRYNEGVRRRTVVDEGEGGLALLTANEN